MRGVSYLAASAAGVGFVADGVEVADGLDMERFQPIPGGGLLVKASRASDGGAEGVRAGAFVVPDLFAPHALGKVPQPHVFGDLGPWFFLGFFGTQHDHYLKESLQQGCLPKGPCEFSFAPPIIDVIESFPAEWVPVAPALEPGEVVFAAGRRYRAHVAASFGERDGSYQTFPGARWPLGRVTRLGAVAEWLDAKAFAALVVGAEAQASLAATPLAEVSALAVAPDGQRICLAEGRVWEFTLKAGRLQHIALVDAGPGLVSCAYDAAGKLARLVGAPAKIRIGDAEIAGDPYVAAAGLHSVGERWLVRGQGAYKGGAGDR